MFEGTLPSISPAGAAEAGALRAFAWPELVAKLGAARDLRAIFADARRGADASFASLAAPGPAIREIGEEAVNLDDLADRKAPSGKAVAAADDADRGDREIR